MRWGPYTDLGAPRSRKTSRNILDLFERQDGSQELQLVGQVVWTRRELMADVDSRLEQPGFGVEFMEGSRFQLDALASYLTRLKSKRIGNVSPLGDSPVPNL